MPEKDPGGGALPPGKMRKRPVASHLETQQRQPNTENTLKSDFCGGRSIDRSIARGPPNKSTQRERERERERKVYGFSPIHLIRVATADGRVSIVMAEVNCVCKKKKKKNTPLP